MTTCSLSVPIVYPGAQRHSHIPRGIRHVCLDCAATELLRAQTAMVCGLTAVETLPALNAAVICVTRAKAHKTAVL